MALFVRGPVEGQPGVPLNGSLVLGQEQDSLGGGFDKYQVLHGDIVQVNVWDSHLAEADVKEMAACRFLASETSSAQTPLMWKLSETSSKVLWVWTSSAVHLPPSSPKIRASRLISKSPICEVIAVILLNDSKTIIDLIRTARGQNTRNLDKELKSGSSCSFAQELTALSLRTSPHYVILPEERTFDATRTLCRLLNASMTVFSSSSENQNFLEEFAPFADVCSPGTTWKLWLGITDAQEDGVWVDVETQEPITYTNFKMPYPIGGSHLECVLMLMDGSWADVRCKASKCGVCSLDRDSPRSLDSPGRPELSPGQNEWVAVEPVCGVPKGSAFNLSLSSCPESQFICNSGDCIDHSYRCNLRYDCIDGSDEDNCNIVFVGSGYRQHLPPRGTNDSTLRLTPKITITRITEVDDLHMAISLEFFVSLTWRDERLSFRQLDPERETSIPASDAAQMWIPDYQLLNLEAGQAKELEKTVTVTTADNATLPHFNSI
ncbi:mannose-binding protein C-like [Penaeus vannamei]|uniref:Mannose-binding protein C-like n=1 Tax=Penaeus vannamei TaxID=6689 RepID=A0A3R7PX78_PENVA|nr:mannose-binding protein C-like [Penaeus vannamei]